MWWQCQCAVEVTLSLVTPQLRWRSSTDCMGKDARKGGRGRRRRRRRWDGPRCDQREAQPQPANPSGNRGGAALPSSPTVHRDSLRPHQALCKQQQQLSNYRDTLTFEGVPSALSDRYVVASSSIRPSSFALRAAGASSHARSNAGSLPLPSRTSEQLVSSLVSTLRTLLIPQSGPFPRYAVLLSSTTAQYMPCLLHPLKGSGWGPQRPSSQTSSRGCTPPSSPRKDVASPPRSQSHDKPRHLLLRCVKVERSHLCVNEWMRKRHHPAVSVH